MIVDFCVGALGLHDPAKIHKFHLFFGVVSLLKLKLKLNSLFEGFNQLPKFSFYGNKSVGQNNLEMAACLICPVIRGN